MFTIEDVKRAYQKTGLKPRQRITVNSTEACPLGALLAEKLGCAEARTLMEITTLSAANTLSAALGVDYNYVQSIICGFDDTGRLEEQDESGLKLGQEARKLCV